MKVFRGKLESACLSIYVSVCQCVSQSVYKILVQKYRSAGRGIKSHLVTALVFLFLAPLALGQRAYVMVFCPSCVRPCVDFFFKHLLL